MWDAEFIRLIGQIHEHKGKPDQLEQLIEIAKIQSTEASNSIEGIQTTNTRLKNLFLKRRHQSIEMKKKSWDIEMY